MSSSSHLFQQSTLKMLQAERCRSVAAVLDLRRAALTERHGPVVALHHEEVWRGRAATASRVRLRYLIDSALYSLGLDLATAVQALGREAFRLEQEAAALRRSASALAEAEARAAARIRALEAPAAAAFRELARPAAS